MITRIQLIFILLLVTSCATQERVLEPSFSLSNRAFHEAPFTPHTGSGDFKNYLALNVAYEPLAQLKNQVEGQVKFSLKDRGEAHITVISPVEFDKALRTKLSMDEINKVALQRKLQEISWRPVCVGRGSAWVAGRKESTYYLVVESAELLGIRQTVQKLFIAKGGNASEFTPEQYFPHITLGYSAKDLHYEDGVVKDLRSCWGKVDIKEKEDEIVN